MNDAAPSEIRADVGTSSPVKPALETTSLPSHPKGEGSVGSGSQVDAVAAINEFFAAERAWDFERTRELHVPGCRMTTDTPGFARYASARQRWTAARQRLREIASAIRDRKSKETPRD